jgi:adenylate cyclase
MGILADRYPRINLKLYYILVESLLLSEKEMAEEPRNSSIGSKRSGDDYQRQTILNLYNSGIERDIISLQLDVSEEEVNKTIEEEEQEKKKKELVTGAKDVSDSHTLSLSSSFYLDAIVDIRLAIRNAQTRMWKALKSEPLFDISMEETHKVLHKFSRSKVTLVILHVDLVGSTQLSMNLQLDRLTTIVQTFSQEMSIMISLYGGYVLKYIGDAVLAFFTTNSAINSYDDDKIKEQYYLPCINAINCAMSMIKIIKEGINPILNQYDYPEMGIRIGIDIGESSVIQYGWDIHTLDNIQTVKEPHLDILGHTINVAVKMTSLAKANGFVIGQFVYDALDENQKSTFEVVEVTEDKWGYTNAKTGGIYRVYRSRMQ